jgi:hypothetical protein
MRLWRIIRGRVGWERPRTSAAGLLLGFHRDEQGGVLEYAMIFGLFAITLILPVWPIDGQYRSIPGMLLEVLGDYFSMIAFFVSWPFL